MTEAQRLAGALAEATAVRRVAEGSGDVVGAFLATERAEIVRVTMKRRVRRCGR